MRIDELRLEYHKQICESIIRVQRKGELEFPNFADGDNNNSRQIAWGIVDRLGCSPDSERITGQTAGTRFERITRNFLKNAFGMLNHIRPGKWIYTSQASISAFEQYEHLAYLDRVIKQDKKLESALRGGYLIKPDIVIGRYPVKDDEINLYENVIQEEDSAAKYTPLRQANRKPNTKILHASISCKWTIRSDRAQNTRTEALNLIRNRKGPLPHVLAVTAEPTPHRLASLALGTGDLDCVYHFALYELIESIRTLGLQDAQEEVEMMVEGRRLRDISDLPFDLAI